MNMTRFHFYSRPDEWDLITECFFFLMIKFDDKQFTGFVKRL